MTRDVVAITIIIASFVLSAYVGLFLMFVGGIKQGVVALQSVPIDASGLAWGTARAILAGPIATIIMLSGTKLGKVIADIDEEELWALN